MAKGLIAIAIHSDLRDFGCAGHSAWSESGVGDAFRRAGRRYGRGKLRACPVGRPVAADFSSLR